MTSNYSNNLSDKEIESLERLKKARWERYERIRKYGWDSAYTFNSEKNRQFNQSEISKTKRILLARDIGENQPADYLMINIDLPDKSYLRGEQVKMFRPWFRHQDSLKPNEIHDYGIARTTRKINELLNSGYKVKNKW